MKKKQKGIICCFSVLFITALTFPIAFFATENATAEIAHTNECTWVHYNSVSRSGLANRGIKEYWVCCEHHDHVFTVPSGSVTEGGTLSQEYINSLGKDDDRIIQSVSDEISDLVNDISKLDVETISFDDKETLDDLNSRYQAIPDTYKDHVVNYSVLVSATLKWNSTFSLVLDASEYNFSNCEYLSNTWDHTIGTDTKKGNYYSIDDIDGNDTFWVKLSNNVDLSNYSELYFYVRFKNYPQNIQYRYNHDYSTKTQVRVENDNWKKFTIDLSTQTSLINLNYFGLAIWYGKAFSDLGPFDITSIYGKNKESTDGKIKIFNSKNETLSQYAYTVTYSRTTEEDDTYGTVSKYYNMSGTGDFIWLSFDSNTDISGFNQIEIAVKTSVDVQLQVRKVSDYVPIIYLPFKANEWQTVLINVNSTNFPTGKLSDIGFSYYQKDQTVKNPGDWYFSDGYGIDTDTKFKVVDGIKSPIIESDENIKFISYANPIVSSDTADQMFQDLNNAGFDETIGLFEGRNATLQAEFVTLLTNYLSNRSDENKNALLTLLDTYCEAIENQNTRGAYYANRKNIGYIALNDILYDIRDFVKSTGLKDNFTDADYDLIMKRILSKTTYLENDGITGLYCLDEPYYDYNDFSLNMISSLVDTYRSYTTKTDPVINLLPYQSYINKETYKTYIQNYINTINNQIDVISYDNYPMMVNNVKSTRYVQDYHLSNLEMVADTIKDNNMDLRTFVHSYSVPSGSGNDQRAELLSANDIYFQINSALAFGSDQIEYFSYSSNKDTEHTSYTDCLVNYSTLEKSSLYYYAQEANLQTKSFGKTLHAFSWNGIIGTGSCTQFDKLENKKTSYKHLSSVSATKPTLTGCFDYKSFNSYFVMSYLNPQTTSDTNSVTLIFDNNVNYALIYLGGSMHAYELDSNNQLSLSLNPAEGALVIPFPKIY